jgi:hypothetical protein
MTATSKATRSDFQVTGWSHAVGGFVAKHQSLILKLAEAETKALEDHLAANPVKAPIYVCGMARAGTTILLDALSSHPDVGTHRYSDYPLVHLPYWWARLAGHMLKSDAPPAERAHRDRILVTPHSPEAMEEALWMTFFEGLHDSGKFHMLDQDTANADFERHYRAHIGKLLLARGRSRYVCKGNYNISRLAYLKKLFADARFIIPVREPAAHIESLMRQHAHFSKGLVDNPAGREHLKRIGHFEFGPDRSPINVGTASDIVELWERGDEIRGWARYWARLYGFIAGQMERTGRLDGAMLLVRYEDFCRAPEMILRQVVAHAGLNAPDSFIEDFARRVSSPTYYSSTLSKADRVVIAEETGTVANKLGYGLST